MIKVTSSNYTICIQGKFLSRNGSRINFSTSETTSETIHLVSENDSKELESDEFPSKLNSALKALRLFKEWHQQMSTTSCPLIKVYLQGDPVYAFYIIKHLLFEQIPFNLKIEKNTVDQDDYLAYKFRQFVIQAAEMDFSATLKSKTQNYPSTFTKCSNDLCIHELKNFLSDDERFLSISIIIPTRNVPNKWINNLVSIINRQRDTNDEIILIDDNDEPRNFIDLKNLYTNFRVIRGNRSGISGARNLGISQSNKELLLFVDSDDEVLPGFIDSQRKFHMKYRNVSATGVWLKAFGSHNRVYPQWDGFSPLGVFQCLPPAGVLMWKKNALVQIGDFQNEFSKGFEDFDLVARAITMDHLIVTIDEIMYLYRRGHVSLSQSLGKDDQIQLSQQVWRNARNLCETNFIDFIQIGLKHGESLYFNSLNYLFLGKEQPQYLFRFAGKMRNNNYARQLWVIIPMKIRRSIFAFAMKH